MSKNTKFDEKIRNFTKKYEIFAKNDDFSGLNGQNDFCRGSIESLGSMEEDRTKTTRRKICLEKVIKKKRS